MSKIGEKALNAIRAAEELLIYDGYTSPQSTAKTILRNIIEGDASARKDEEEVADSVSPSPPSSPATQQPDRCTSWRQWWAMKPKLPEQNMQQLEPMGDKELKQVEMGCMAWLLHDGEHEASLRLSRILQRLTDAEKRLSERESVNLAIAANAILDCPVPSNGNPTDTARMLARTCADAWGLTTDDEPRRGTDNG